MHKIELIPAKLSDYPIIKNLARFYVYDMNQYMDWKTPEDGLFKCFSLKKYWKNDSSYPFLIRINNELAGFVIINKKGCESCVDYNIAQFFIVRKFSGKGLGREVAFQCFNQFHVVALNR